jgi:hypothetical protein
MIWKVSLSSAPHPCLTPPWTQSCWGGAQVFLMMLSTMFELMESCDFRDNCYTRFLCSVSGWAWTAVNPQRHCTEGRSIWVGLLFFDLSPDSLPFLSHIPGWQQAFNWETIPSQPKGPQRQAPSPSSQGRATWRREWISNPTGPRKVAPELSLTVCETENEPGPLLTECEAQVDTKDGGQGQNSTAAQFRGWWGKVRYPKNMRASDILNAKELMQNL